MLPVEVRGRARGKRRPGRRHRGGRHALYRLHGAGDPSGRCKTHHTAYPWCDWCMGDFPAADVDVDHVQPLALGGTDTDGNVQVLCRGCHQLKTATEFGRMD
ncbi:HNH endonuclease [Streptomyces sp. NPDC048370]|uniref:HNH endonuclease n=1 Tax=Streptomyces sp. NPDC048370 TaxID=3365540 RepID=UPI003717A26D